MSIFRVTLTQGNQGDLDAHALGQYTGDYPLLDTPVPHSIQRTAYVMGPNKINRKLADGATFTDSNYWKRYCATPVGPLLPEQAIVSLVSDDGSSYSDFNPSIANYPKVYNVTIPSSSTFASNAAAGNICNILSDTGSYAVYCQLTLNTLTDVKVRLNGNVNSVFDLTSSAVQIFNPGDMAITLIEFQWVSGSSGTCQVLLSIASVSNS